MRRPSRQFPRPVQVAVGPFAGMHDSQNPSEARPDLARLLLNYYVPAGTPGAPVEGRAGMTLLGTAGSPLGGVGARTGQFLGQFTKLDGTQYTIAIVGGKFYTVNWATETWTEVLTSSHFASAAITLSTTQRFTARVLGNKIWFTDGVNTGWGWDGTAGGGLTKLTGVPVLARGMDVYYSKLTAPKAAALGTFVWSEERDPTTGYDVGGYNNAWDFDVTGTEQLTAMAATNEALYVFRARSISRVLGRMDVEFQTQGTRTDVDERVGTTGIPLVTQRGVFFVDAEGRPHVIVPGGGVVALWPLCATAISAVNRTALGNAEIVYHPGIDAVLVGLPSSISAAPNVWLVFRLDSDASARMAGLWRFPTAADRAGIVLDGNGRPTFAYLGNADGYVYVQGHMDGSQWADTTVSGSTEVSVPITHEVETHAVRPTADIDVLWDRVDWVVKGYGPTAYGANYSTTRKTTTLPAQSTPVGSGSLLGVGLLGTFVLGGASLENRLVWGTDAPGRYIVQRLTHADGANRSAVVGAVVRGYEVTDNPLIP